MGDYGRQLVFERLEEISKGLNPKNAGALIRTAGKPLKASGRGREESIWANSKLLSNFNGRKGEVARGKMWAGKGKDALPMLNYNSRRYRGGALP